MMKSITEPLRRICYDGYYPSESDDRRCIRRAVLSHAVFDHHTLAQLSADDPTKYPPIRVVLPFGSAESEQDTPPLVSMLYQHAYAAAICDHAQTELLQAIRPGNKEAIITLKRDPSYQVPPFGEEPEGDDTERRSSAIQIRFFSRDAFIPQDGANNDSSVTLPHGSSMEMVRCMPQWKAQFVFYYPPLGVYFTSIQQLFLVHDAMSRGWCDSVRAPMCDLFGCDPTTEDSYAVFGPIHGENTGSLDARRVNDAINYVLCAFLKETALPLKEHRSLGAVPNGFIPEFCRYFTTKITTRGYIHVELGEYAIPVSKYVVSKACFQNYPEAERERMVGGRVPSLSSKFRTWVIKQGSTTHESTRNLWEGKANLEWFFSRPTLGKRRVDTTSLAGDSVSDPPAKRARIDSGSDSDDEDDVDAFLQSGCVVGIQVPGIVRSDGEFQVDLAEAAEAMVQVGNTEHMDMEPEDVRPEDVGPEDVEEEEEDPEPFPATQDIISDMDIYQNLDEAAASALDEDSPHTPRPLSPMPASRLDSLEIDLGAKDGQCVQECPFGSRKEEDKQRKDDRGTIPPGMKIGGGGVLETDSEDEFYCF